MNGYKKCDRIYSGVYQVTKVLILSDSHGLTSELEDIKERHQLQHMIHCGDSELEFNAHEMENFVKVAGNCDFDASYPNEEKRTIDGITFLITHGHLYNVKNNLMTLAYRAEEVDAQIICFGHTHIAGTEQSNKRLFINPGSIRLPKARNEKTYAIMEWENVDEINVTFYTPQGDIVEALTHQKSI
jgi:putative phosphoesterase